MEIMAELLVDAGADLGLMQEWVPVGQERASRKSEARDHLTTRGAEAGDVSWAWWFGGAVPRDGLLVRGARKGCLSVCSSSLGSIELEKGSAPWRIGG
jgi:hypothetical protein